MKCSYIRWADPWTTKFDYSPKGIIFQQKLPFLIFCKLFFILDDSF